MTIKTKKTLTSPAKIKANRHNALKSTGPKTIAGKSVSRWNCLQHGLLAKAAVVTMGDGAEKGEALRFLLEQLTAQYKPVGAIEEILVERIATSYWRLKRCQEAEVGEVIKNRGLSWIDRKYERERTFYQRVNGVKPGTNRYWIFRQSSYGILALLRLLREAAHQLREGSQLSPTTEAMLKSAFEASDVLTTVLDTGTSSRAKIKYLESVAIPHYDGLARDQKESEDLSDHAHIKLSAVPDSIRSDLLQRYETGIERQMYRAINTLEKLQSIRFGINTGH